MGVTGRTDRLPRCDGWLPRAKERCARAAGHRHEHRSRYALDNDNLATRGRLPDPYAFRGGEWVPR